MTDLAKLVIRMEAENAKLRSSLEKNTAQLRKFESSTKRHLGGVQKAFKGIESTVIKLGGAFATYLGARALYGSIKGAVDLGDQIQKLALRTGATTEELSQMRYVVERGGSSLDAYANALRGIQQSTSQAQQGLQTQRRAFADLNINVEEFAKLSPQQQFDAIAEAMGGITDQSTRTRVAMDLMKRAGTEMLQVMAGGVDDIRNLRIEADKLGGTISQKQADQAAAVKDAYTKLDTAFKGVAQSIAFNAGPALVEFANTMSDVLPKAINYAVKGLNRMEAGFYDTKESILDTIIAASEFDEKVAKFLHIPESAYGILNIDPARTKRLLNDLNETRMKLISLNKSYVDLQSSSNKPFSVVPSSLPNVSGSGTDSGSLANIKLNQDIIDQQTKMKGLASDYIQLLEKSKSPVEKLGDEYEKINELFQAGFLNPTEYEQRISEAQTRFGDYVKKSKEQSLEWSQAWSGTTDRFASGVGDAVAGAVLEQKNLADSMHAVLRGVLSQVISTLTEIGVKRVLLSQTSIAATAEETAASTTAAATTAAAWSPAAALSSIATFGANIAPALLGIAAVFALTKSLTKRGAGGSVNKDVPIIVGDQHRSEVFIPNSSGIIHPDAASFGGGGQVVLNMNVYANDTAGFDGLLMKRRNFLYGLMQDVLKQSGRRF